MQTLQSVVAVLTASVFAFLLLAAVLDKRSLRQCRRYGHDFSSGPACSRCFSVQPREMRN